jgi:hypothetical protein
MRKTFAVIWIVLSLVFVLLCSLAAAQSNNATVSGTVMDSDRAVVPDVAITVSSTATGLKRQTTTNGEGLFTVPLLPPGLYLLQAEREGFSIVKIDHQRDDGAALFSGRESDR